MQINISAVVTYEFDDVASIDEAIEVFKERVGAEKIGFIGIRELVGRQLTDGCFDDDAEEWEVDEVI